MSYSRCYSIPVTALCIAALLTLGAGCGNGSEDDDDDDEVCPPVDNSYDPDIDPADFSSTIDNSFFPLVVGTVFRYEGGGEVDEVTVTDQTRTILGVECRVVRDVVTVDGEITEDTYDWYAQDSDGNVWYFGEDSTEYEDGEANTEGSWEAGVDGAKPGIVFPAEGVVGESYRQEYYPCEAEDMAETVSLDEEVSVSWGDFSGCRETRDFTPLEPDVSEYKYYCEDVGLVLEVDDETGVRNELVEVTPP